MDLKTQILAALTEGGIEGTLGLSEKLDAAPDEIVVALQQLEAEGKVRHLDGPVDLCFQPPRFPS